MAAGVIHAQKASPLHLSPELQTPAPLNREWLRESGSERVWQREWQREIVSRPTGLCIKWPQEMDAKGCRAGVLLKPAVGQLDAKLPVAVTSKTVRSNNNMHWSICCQCILLWQVNNTELVGQHTHTNRCKPLEGLQQPGMSTGGR